MIITALLLIIALSFSANVMVEDIKDKGLKNIVSDIWEGEE